MTARSGNPKIITLLVLGVVLLVLAGQRAWTWRSQVNAQHRQEAAAAAASAEVTRLISVSAKDADSAFTELLAGATASFRQDLKSQAAQLRKAVAASQVEATGKVVSTGVGRATGDQATVYVAATGTVANVGTTGPENRDYRVKVEMRRVGDRWLVAGLEFVA